MSTYEIVKTTNGDEAPSEIVFVRGKFVVTRCLIQYDHETAHVTYFADSRNGKKFGSFASKSEAIDALPRECKCPKSGGCTEPCERNLLGASDFRQFLATA